MKPSVKAPWVRVVRAAVGRRSALFALQLGVVLGIGGACRRDEAGSETKPSHRQAEDSGETPGAEAAAPPPTGTPGGSTPAKVCALPSGFVVASLAVTKGSVYVAGVGSILRVPKSGDGELSTLTDSIQPWVHSMFVDSTHVYWFTGSTIVRYDERANETSEVFTPTQSALALSLTGDAERLYLGTPGCAALISVPKVGGETKTATQPSSVYAGGALPLAAGAGALYCGGGAGGPTRAKLYRWPLHGEQIELFQDLGPADEHGYVHEVHAMVEVGDTLWFLQGRPSGHRGHELMRAPVSGGDMKSLIAVDDSGAHHLVHDTTRSALYWLWVTQQKIARYSTSTGELTTITLESPPSGPLAADEESLYWTTEGALMRTSKF